MSLRIAYVVNEMVVGGTQTHLRQVLRLLDRQRFSPILVCLSGRGALLEDVRDMGVRVICPAPSLGFQGLNLAKRVLATARVFRREGVHIVHNYLLRANLVGSLAARLARVPVVLCSTRGCHELHGAQLLAAKVGNALADRVMVNAVAVREFVHEHEGCPREKMFVVPSGIDTARFRPLPPGHFKARLGIPEDRLVIGTVTRQRIRKGVEEFLRALAEVRHVEPRAHGLIVGEVEETGELADIVRSLGIESHLTLAGRRQDMPEVYSAMDMYVLSSHDEGMSNALLEALAMGKPVVATNVGGTGEVVEHGKTGLLVPPKDWQALARALERLLAERERWTEMAEAGRATVERRFSARAMVQDMERVYLALAERRGLRKKGEKLAA
ncbi:MAG: glycosyl transferase family 1 [Candidatus Binatia bacterium]|nr:MAG: glycosyl transferase family 1 [Candidatus Binatia bacterium]